MATALHMQLPHHRPTVDRSPSFDQPRARSTPPFLASYDPSPSPSIRPSSHSRTSSNASNTSPYQQPFSGSNFPQPNHTYSAQPQSWSTTALPTSAFHPPSVQPYPNQAIFQPGFQQSQADFAAWTAAYQQMVMASVAAGAVPAIHGEQQGDRRRTNSGPQTYAHSPGHLAHHHPSHAPLPSPSHHSSQPQGFHPYQRGHSLRPSDDKIPRSSSQPIFLSNLDQLSPSSSMSSTRTPPTCSDHHRTSSIDSAVSSIIPPRVASRMQLKKDSNPAEHSRGDLPRSASAPSFAKPSKPPQTSVDKTVTPLLPGPIANATNSLPQVNSRSSPLAQSPIATTPEPTEKMVKSGGLKGRLKKALEKDSKRDGKSSTPPSPVRSTSSPAVQQVFTSPSETSTRSATPPTTPPQDLPTPSPPFANQAAMASDLSLAETERTTTATSELGVEKAKRSLFRMKNMSTDNISLASTVSSASLMIRKMGSIGKLARRNSLMGISKIFKDKPKDEDAALPEKEVKKKDKKSKKGKTEIAPAAVSHVTAESDIISEEEDRALAGLSPAAKLARQHTLKSKAEAAQKEADQPEPTEITDDTPQPQLLPSIASVTGPEVLHVTPRQGPTVVHAVAVSEHEYDSEDDSSEGETVEDVTMSLGRSRLSDAADAEFQATWGKAYIDRYAVPKKGILKPISIEDLEASAHRQRSDLHHPRAHSPTTHASFAPFESPEMISPYQNPTLNTSAPNLHLVTPAKPHTPRSMTVPARRRIIWAPECAVYSTYDAGTYDRRSEPATCNRLTPDLAMAIKQELNAFKLEMPVHPQSKVYTHYFA